MGKMDRKFDGKQYRIYDITQDLSAHKRMLAVAKKHYQHVRVGKLPETKEILSRYCIYVRDMIRKKKK